MAVEPKQHKRPPIGKAAKHKRSARHAPRERRTHSTARGYDYRWEKFRRSFLAANPLCEYCLARGQITAATVVDHDLPHEHDPHLFWNNTYSALCAKDHNSTKQRMERRYRGDALLQAVRVAKGKA